MDNVRQALDTSARRSSHTMAQHRSAQRKVLGGCADDTDLSDGIDELACGNRACDPHVHPRREGDHVRSRIGSSRATRSGPPTRAPAHTVRFKEGSRVGRRGAVAAPTGHQCLGASSSVRMPVRCIRAISVNVAVSPDLPIDLAAVPAKPMRDLLSRKPGLHQAAQVATVFKRK